MTMPRGKGRMKSAGKRVLHDTTAKINPLDKKIDQNDTADHGVESMRLAYRAGKQGTRTIKTVDRTVKTTAKTIKAAKKHPVPSFIQLKEQQEWLWQQQDSRQMFWYIWRQL